MSKDYRVLLYYKYEPIQDPENFRDEHLKFCKSIGLRGRILVGSEGINGTVSGTVEQTEQYKDYLHSLQGFEDVWFKEDEADGYAHKKMHVRYREEIVSLRLEDDIDPEEITGDYLKPAQFRDALIDEDTIVLDTRNDYEYDLGHFKGAIRPEIRNFRDLPNWVKDNKEKFMDKKVVVYCTGGVRCEKFSGWMLREGLAEQVGQLEGGIDTYGKDPETKGDLWEGSMYVFDERISVPINQVNPTVVGKDHYDGTPCDRYVNCANPECNEQVLMSEENEHKYLRGCTVECRKHPRNRYVSEHNLSEAEWEKRLNKIDETLYEEVH
ncbi:MAG TPA: rhodanese-related sulfurtransferase [Bacteroidales bacterium]|nr:rhodanese-related sulfurtransferase [Bacteroidales bacterium]